MCFLFFFFFFKQKTAYEMRISDCSSDVCSSDLLVLVVADRRASADFAFGAGETVPAWLSKTDDFVATLEPVVGGPRMGGKREKAEIGRASCRERGGQDV